MTDREKTGNEDHFYRVNAGAVPYIARVFPLGVRAGESTEVSVEGVNLGGTNEVKIDAPNLLKAGRPCLCKFRAHSTR